MSIRSDVKRVLVLGSGPVVVGQGAEFDYAGTQACIGYRSAGVDVVVLNDNHASYMTTGFSGVTVELREVTAKNALEAFEQHKCDAIASGFGGQTGLNVAAELVDSGAIDDSKILGTPRAGVEIAENRQVFARAAEEAGAPCAQAVNVSTPAECERAAEQIKLPCIVRSSYTLGGAGTKICSSLEEMIAFVQDCCAASQNAACIAEASLLDLVEIEFEVIRDCAGNSIAVCGMENVDPVGIHTGDSVVVAPIQTLDDELTQELRAAALKLADKIGVIGACNVQFAVDVTKRKWWTIECNPRTSRSSALASKVTAYPIARIAALVTLGLTLDELHIDSTGAPAALEPALDYVVVKIPTWSDTRFESLCDGALLSSSMRATGESMGIGLTFAEAYFKALRGSAQHACEKRGLEFGPIPSRPAQVVQALLDGQDACFIASHTKWQLWFVCELKKACETIKEFADSRSAASLAAAKKAGAPDYLLSQKSGLSRKEILKMRSDSCIRPGYRFIDGTAGELPTRARYAYSTYRSARSVRFPDRKRVALIVGSGPIVIGQGIEFDCCSTEAAAAVRDLGLFSVVINCNPETVSTDYDMSDALIFDPVDSESVDDVAAMMLDTDIILAQFGGQAAISAVSESELASKLARDQISLANIAGDREKFAQIAGLAGVKRPEQADALSFPVLVRPSHIIGGIGMSVAHNREEMIAAVKRAEIHGATPVICDKIISGVEFDVDIITRRDGSIVAFVSEQLDPPGIHSGDSRSVWPSRSKDRALAAEIAAKKICQLVRYVGVGNVQMIVNDDGAYAIELNARASRTATFISKAAGVNLIKAAVVALLDNAQISLLPQRTRECQKTPVFSSRLPKTALGPMMTSTGERFLVNLARDSDLQDVKISA